MLCKHGVMRTTTGCRKRRMSRLDAMILCANSQMKRTRGTTPRQERNYYYCDDCRAWHVTSQDRK